MRATVELARIPNAMLRLAASEEELDYSEAEGEEPLVITLFSLTVPADFATLRARGKRVRTACLFAMDSQCENALI